MAMTDEELLQKLEDSTKNATHHQLETLRSILQHQGGVSYLQRHLQGHELLHPSSSSIDADTFKRYVPLSQYEDYADHINQMADVDSVGDHDQGRSPLSVDPLLCFFYSSGTSTMKPKLIPYFDSALSKATSYIAHQGSGALLRKLFPPRPEVNKVLWFIYADTITKTKGGYKVMAASTYPLHRTTYATWSQFMSCTSPREVIMGSNVEHQMYCHLLCGLRYQNSVDGIRAAYAIGLIKVIGMLQTRWEQLCDDIENGFPSSEVTDVAMRDSVTELLSGPQPEFSKKIRSICEEKDWGGILSKLWPNARYIRCVTTGSMRHYYPKLKYYAGDIPLLGGDYFASECCVGINSDSTQPPEKTRFVMLPTAAYFEFLPFDLSENDVAGEETLDFSGVEVGKMYEVVVTTYRGLYRYRLGDIVRVVGFHNSSPEVEFVMRAPKCSSEIVTERELLSAVESFQAVVRNVLAAEIVEFASFLDAESRPKQLRIYIEFGEACVFLKDEDLQESIKILRSCCSSLEDGLGGLYKVQTDKRDIGSLLLSLVKPGSFDRLSQIAIKHGASATQYKPPKIIRNRQIADFLQESAVATISLDSFNGQ